MYGRIFAGEAITKAPVCNGVLAVEQPRLSQYKGSCTDRRDASAPSGCISDPPHEVAIMGARLRSFTSHNDERVDRSSQFLNRSGLAERDTPVGPKASFRPRGGKNYVIVRSVGKDLERPGYIQDLDGGRADDNYTPHHFNSRFGRPGGSPTVNPRSPLGGGVAIALLSS
jgi:hypothetical protein